MAERPSPLSPAVGQILSAASYDRLVVTGAAPATAAKLLASVCVERLFAAPVRNDDDARAVLAGLWLWHDAVDESHAISQSIATPSGSFWHAIMHRREGDFANAKYWYARCRHHPALERVAAAAREALGSAADSGPLHRLLGDAWDPDGFVDVVEAVHRNRDDPLYATAVRLQQLEWRALFDHCARGAAGAP
jgi:hypothetical protein